MLEHDGCRVAIEIKLTGKGATRLGRIATACTDATWFTELRFLAGTVPVARRLARLLADRPDATPLALLGGTAPASTLAPVAGLQPEIGAAIKRLAEPLIE